QLLKMVRRSERKLQPKGFFRPKTKTAAKTTNDATAAKSQSNGAGKPKTAALPSGSVVRQRQKPGDAKKQLAAPPNSNGNGVRVPKTKIAAAIHKKNVPRWRGRPAMPADAIRAVPSYQSPPPQPSPPPFANGSGPAAYSAPPIPAPMLMDEANGAHPP